MKRLIGLFLAATMVFSLVTGCSVDSDEDTSTGTNLEVGTQSTESGETTTEAPTEEVTEAPTEEPRNEIQYPLTDAGSLSWYVKDGINIHLDYDWDVSKSPLHNYLKVATGVDIEWQFPQNHNINIMDIPFIATGSDLDFERLFADGLIRDLTPYLEEYAPDYWAWLNEDEARMKKIALTTGEIVYFACGVEEEYTCTYGPIIRKDWLDECGLEIPYTLDEWETVLKAFRDKYDIAPFNTTRSIWKKMLGLASGTGAHGGLNLMLYQENGEIKCAQLQGEWKELIVTMNRWFEEGLIDPGIETSSPKSHIVREASRGHIGLTVVDESGMAQIMSAETNDEISVNPHTPAEWIAIPYPVLNKGDQPVYTHYEGMDISAGTFITTECPEEKLITAIKMLNYGYTEEGKLTWNFGEQGVSWDYDEQGEVQLMELVLNDESGKSSALSKYSPMNYLVAPTIKMDRFTELKYDTSILDALEVWGRNTANHQYYIDQLRSAKEDANRCADLESTLDTFLFGFAMRCIQGEYDIVADWDFMVNELKTLGLEEYIQITQKAYDRTYKD